MTFQYILNDAGEPVEEPDILAWGRWLQTSGARRIAHDEIGNHLVSTIFIGLEETLFETMIFCQGHECEHDHLTNRYSTKREALVGHAEMVQIVRGESS